MYIPTWIIILAIIIAIFYFRRQKINKDPAVDDDSPGAIWGEATKFKRSVMEESLLIEDYLCDERSMIEAMEMDMLRLRERYKHDSNKQIEIAQDWFDFAKAIHNLKFTKEMMDVLTEHDELESHRNNAIKINTIIQEIIKRTEGLLGEESNIKKVREVIEDKVSKEIVN